MNTGSVGSSHWLRWAHLLVFLAFFVAWTIALLSPVPEESARELLGNADNVFYFGKSLHVSAYVWLTVLGGSMWCLRTRWSWLVVVLILHGELTEFFQQFVGRHMAVRDALLDSVGVLIGALIVWGWWRFRTTDSVVKPSTANLA